MTTKQAANLSPYNDSTHKKRRLYATRRPFPSRTEQTQNISSASNTRKCLLTADSNRHNSNRIISIRRAPYTHSQIISKNPPKLSSQKQSFNHSITNYFTSTRKAPLKTNYHAFNNRTDFLSCTNGSLISALFNFPFSEKKLISHNDSQVRSRVNAARTIGYENKLNSTDLFQDTRHKNKSFNQTCSISHQLNDTDTTNKSFEQPKLNIIESITNLQFENECECTNKESQITKLKKDHMNLLRNDIRPMIYFNTKIKKDDGTENNDSSEIETPCFVEQLSKKNSHDYTTSHTEDKPTCKKADPKAIMQQQSGLIGKYRSKNMRNINIVLNNTSINSLLAKVISGNKKVKI